MKVTIGLETHVQLNTQSKAFCGCRNPVNLEEEPEPNTLLCETCLGLPGSKPRANRAMLEKALRVSLALECTIARKTYFSRKTYFYPDMSKNFQITQYEVPLAATGRLRVGDRDIRIKRVHMEEDPSKIVHVGGLGGSHTLLDYNRAGVPLIEIVTEPDFTSPEEARLFLQKLENILEYLGVYDSSSRAVFKSDANISLSGGKRVEVKNITGTREIEQALKYEIVRQHNHIKRGGKIVQSTRTWDPATGTSRELRLKETEADYGYIFEPDLTVQEIKASYVSSIRKALPELPDQRMARFVKQYGLHPKTAEALVSELDLSELYERAAGKTDPKLAATWVAGYLKKSLNYRDLRYRGSGLKEEWLFSLLKTTQRGELTDRNAELVLRGMVEKREPPEKAMKRLGIGKRVDPSKDSGVTQAIEKVLKANPGAVQDYKSGEEKALHFLVGMAMRETRGQVDANDAKRLILKLLE